MNVKEGAGSNRRIALKKVFAGIAGALAGALGVREARAKTTKKQSNDIQHFFDPDTPQDQVPLFSSVVVHNGLVYVAGKGYHGEGDIRVHTDEVLKQIERELIRVGSSMDRVLKVNVYLHDIRDYAAMNEVYRGRFGNKPPVRTTVACPGGIPGNSLVEIDCIAALKED